MYLGINRDLTQPLGILDVCLGSVTEGEVVTITSGMNGLHLGGATLPSGRK